MVFDYTTKHCSGTKACLTARKAAHCTEKAGKGHGDIIVVRAQCGVYEIYKPEGSGYSARAKRGHYYGRT